MWQSALRHVMALCVALVIPTPSWAQGVQTARGIYQQRQEVSKSAAIRWLARRVDAEIPGLTEAQESDLQLKAQVNRAGIPGGSIP